MRNLKVVGRSLSRFSSPEQHSLPLSATSWDAGADGLVCAFGPTESRAVIELKRLPHAHHRTEHSLEHIASWDAPCPLPSLACDSIVDLHHFSGSSTSCLVLAGGDIILVREDPLPGEELVEIVGSVDAGISAAAWSPDEELLAITTQTHTLLFMTRDIENIVSVEFSAEDVKLSNHVSVGWGKSETQFKGKRAKALQDPTMPERVDEGVLSAHDDLSVNISWRGDGAFVAINSIEQDKRRMVRVFSREGLIDSVSEPVDGLEGALSWRPSGNLIAGIQRLEDRVDVVFFERNGLRHGQFDLRLADDEIKRLDTSLKLKWNSDSNVLAVCYPHKVQLWTMSNYHYYLKQELLFPESGAAAVACSWHSEKPLSAAFSTSDSLQILEFLYAADIGPVLPPNDFGIVASVDGLMLHVTPLRVANIPPPMSMWQLALEDAIVDTAISMSGNRLAVLSNQTLSLYSLEVSKQPVSAPKLLWRGEPLVSQCPRRVVFVGDDRVFVLTDYWDDNDCGLWESEHDGLVQFKCRVGKGIPISGLLTSLDYKDLYMYFQNGALHQLGSLQDFGSNCGTLVNRFPSSAPEVKVVKVGENNRMFYFGLTKSGILYANERVLVQNCTSFIVTPAHLVFTTTQHYLKFVHLVDANELEIPPDDPQTDERCRSIERGARLVTVIPSTYSVVLQMPRGNLETIYPRALVLAAVRRSIEARCYGEAFLTCRTQRVDMNILHDHAPAQFMENITLIVQQIERVDHIDLLLSQLREEDVSETMYRETTPNKSADAQSSKRQPRVQGTHGQAESKVNRICDGFIAVLEQGTYRDQHFQNIITAHVCKCPSHLDTALEMIGQLQETQHPWTEKAAEHICFLADVNKLYDTALGIYNLDLALLIAQQSQKDPREYLPYLRQLQDLPLLRRKFTIDDQLGRHAKALAHLVAMDDFEDLKSYVVKHALYVDALDMYQYNTDRLDQIMRLYAEHLSLTNCPKEAAIAYEYLSEYSSAWPLYRAANLWCESLSCASQAGVPETEYLSLATTLAEGLAEAKDYHSASIIYLDYLSEIITATKLLCKGHLFAEAVRIVTLHRRPELVSEVIDPGLAEASGSMTEFLAECKTQLQAQVPRLRDLRQKKEEDPLAFYEGMIDDGNIPDNISLAPTNTTSGGTFMTRYTRRTGTIDTTTTRKTSKNKRREERKRARGKKGSVYEEEYLVNSIERLIARINSMNDEVTRLVEGLTKRRMRKQASVVTQAMQDVIKRCEAAVAEMYPTDAAATQPAQEVNDAAAPKPSGGDAVLWASLEEGNIKREAPILTQFKGLSLLG